MTEWKDMPFSGVKCDEKTKMCKAWFVQSREGITKTVELRDIPAEPLQNAREAEVAIEFRLRNTTIDIG